MIDQDIKTYIKKDGQFVELEFNRDNLAWWQILNSVKIAFSKVKEPLPEFVVYEEVGHAYLFILIMPQQHKLEEVDAWLYHKTAIEQELKFQAEANNPSDDPDLAPVKFYLL